MFFPFEEYIVGSGLRVTRNEDNKSLTFHFDPLCTQGEHNGMMQIKPTESQCEALVHALIGIDEDLMHEEKQRRLRLCEAVADRHELTDEDVRQLQKICWVLTWSRDSRTVMKGLLAVLQVFIERAQEEATKEATR